MKAIQLKEADAVIMRYLRPLQGTLFRRIKTDLAVCEKGNETRMGKGKGGFSYWAARVPTGKVIFEVDGPNVHEEVAREAFRVASSKLPGVYEFIRKGDAPKMGFKAVEEPRPVVNYLDPVKTTNRRYLNVLASKQPEIRMYMARRR
jgi:ribosomal protein L16